MGSRGKYLWRTPQGYVAIKHTPYCLKVLDYGHIVYWDRNRGQEISMGQILEDIDTLDDKEREALISFLEEYATIEEQMLFWCHGIQRTARTLLKKYAKELESYIISERYKRVNEHKDTQKEGVGNAEV
jgi:hypothetical protein